MFSSNLKQNIAFFNALNKLLIEGNQYPFESKYRSLANIPSSAIWNDVVPYCASSADADNFVTLNPTIGRKYTQVSLTPIPGSNNQAWYINDGGTFITKWIAPTDVPHPITNDPSDGFQAILYRNDNTIIPPTLGRWNIFYAQGIVLFEAGFTPINLGWGIPKITCYTYIGATGGGGASSVIDDIQISSSKTWSSQKLNNIVPSLETYINIISPVPANTILNVAQLSNSYFNRIGDVPNIGGNISQFNRKSLQIFRNSIRLQKNIDVFYVNGTSIYLNVNLQTNEQLFIQS